MDRRVGLICVLATAAGVPNLFAADSRVPVIVELFTSEGCSSCPPADELLSDLDRHQPLSGVRVIALEEHVDYWNHLGWIDRFSSPQFRGRQTEYAELFRAENIYTPQMVVNGQSQFLGSDTQVAYNEIGKALSRSPLYSLGLKPEGNAKNPALIDLSISVRSETREKPQPADVYLAVTESRLVSRVGRGENQGRVLQHAPVVRSFGVIASLDDRPFREVGMKSTLKLPDDWQLKNLRAVVFVQDRASRRMVGAAVVNLR